jgi:translation elongation factor EF-G
MTSGRASYSMQFDHYAEIPPNIAETVTKKVTGRG